MSDAVIIEAKQEHRASIIWLHGLGADGNDFAPVVPELNLADDLGIKFIFPHAPKRPVTINSGMVMRAWYDIRDPDLGKERERSEFEDSAAILEGYIDEELKAGIPADRILLAGFSQGGAIALHCGLGYAQPLAGLLILSSYLPFQDILEEDRAQANNSTSILMLHGQYDPVIPIDFARQSCTALQARKYPVEWHDFPMQHGVCLEELQIIGQWLAARLKC